MLAPSTICVRRRGRLGLFAAVCAGGLAAASVAWACTPIMGKGSLDGTRSITGTLEGGPRGSTVTLTTGWLKSKDLSTGEPLSSAAVFRILFFDHDSFAAAGNNSSACMASKFVMKRTDGTKAKDVPAPANLDDPHPTTGHSGAFVVSLKVPSVFPVGHSRAGQKVPLGKSVICGMEQGSAQVAGAPGPKDQTGTPHIVFKVTSV